MSAHAMCWAFDQQLPPVQKLSLIYLSDIANPNSMVNVVPSDIARFIDQSETHANVAIADLINLGLIEQRDHFEDEWGEWDGEYFLACPPETYPAPYPDDDEGGEG